MVLLPCWLKLKEEEEEEKTKRRRSTLWLRPSSSTYRRKEFGGGLQHTVVPTSTHRIASRRRADPPLASYLKETATRGYQDNPELRMS